MENFPLITIALAMYKPNLDWFEIQLRSINAQTYPNLELLIWNDAQKEFAHENLIYKCITKIPCKIYQGEKNLGSNGAFFELTKHAKGQYIAYCDQDDEWLSNKIFEMYRAIQKEKADLVCCDMIVIDGDNKKIGESILDIRPKQAFYEGDNLFKYLIWRNFVTGCASLVSTKFAKEAFPIPLGFYHDWWIAIYVAYCGKVFCLKESLLKYRVHGKNQTGAKNYLNSKNEYFHLCIERAFEQSQALKLRYDNTIFYKDIVEFYNIMALRRSYFQKPTISKALKLVCFLFQVPFGKKGIIFELILPLMTESVFKYTIALFWKNRI